MKVSELIEELQKFESDTEVVVAVNVTEGFYLLEPSGVDEVGEEKCGLFVEVYGCTYEQLDGFVTRERKE